MTTSDIVIDARSIVRVFGSTPPRTALDRVDLQVRRGEFVAVFGPSGSGKSTLLSIVGGLDRGYAGTATLLGHDLANTSDRELSRLRGMQVGFVFQAFHLLDHLSVIDNVLVPALFHSRPGSLEDARRALARVGLQDRMADSAALLSGGQRQRVAIARAIAHRPALLICDEPTGNLDADTAAQVVDIFAELNRDGTTVLCATHDPRISNVSTRTIHLREGRLVQSEAAS